MNLVKYPKHSLNLYVVLGGNLPKPRITTEKDTSAMTLRQGKCESVMHGKFGRHPHYLLRARDSLPRQVNHFEASSQERLFLCGRKLQKLFFKERIGDQEFIREPQEDI